MHSRVAFFLLCATPWTLQAQALERDAYVQHGVCPFECCRYGPWVSRDTFAVHASPSASAPTIAMLHPGDSVVSETGDVYLAPVGLAVVLRDLQPAKDGWRDSLFQPAIGDTVMVLSYLGEGSWTVRQHGALHWSYDFWESNYLDPDPLGRLIRAPVAHWWVKLRPSDAIVGWVLIPSSSPGFDGADACG